MSQRLRRIAHLGFYVAASFLALGGCSTRRAGPGKPGKEAAILQICVKCGEIKGSDECCKLEGKAKCAMCGLIKGSPGCCKIPKGQMIVRICPKCGEIKGSDECCKLEGRTICPMCGLIKGSPGCCKIPKGQKEE